MSCRREPGRSELHLSKGNGGVFTFPVYPDYSLCQNRIRQVIKFDQCATSLKTKVFMFRYRSELPDYCCWWHKDHWGWSCSSSCTTSLPCRPWHSGSPEHQGPCPGLRMAGHYGTSWSHLTMKCSDIEEWIAWHLLCTIVIMVMYIQQLPKHTKHV